MATLASTFRNVGLALLIAGALMLCAQRAEATCGNYVIILSGQSMDEHGKSDRPCQGPSCSQSPSIPFTPAPAPAPPSIETKALAAGLVDDSDGDGRINTPSTSDGEVIHQPSSIFHPPRG